MKTLLLSSLILCPIIAPAATLVGLWEFNNSSNLAQATIGSALTLNGTTTSTTGVTGSDGAIDVATGIASWISVPNPIGANGASGTPTRTNQFTIVLDFQIPDFKDGGADNGAFTGIFDFSNEGTADADYFIRKQVNVPELGVSTQWPYVGAGSTVGGDGTAGTVLAGTWYRLVLAADVGVGRSVYLNGNLVGSHGAGTRDSVRQSIDTALRVMWDNTEVENSRAIISNIALFDDRLDATEVAALGVAGAAIPEPSALVLAGLGGLLLARRRR